MLEIQRKLRTGTPLQAFREAPYYLKVIEHNDGRVMFNYSQIDSPPRLQEVQEARGLILEKGTWDVVALSFHRFFNQGEFLAHSIKLTEAFALEKLDGSLISLYAYKNTWYFSSRGSIELTHPLGVPYQNETLGTLISKVFNLEAATPKLDPSYTYIFELTSPANRVVTAYTTTTLSLLGARHNQTGYELTQSQLDVLAQQIGSARPRYFKVSNDAHALETMQAQGATFEGFVLVSERPEHALGHARIKLKNPSYVALHHFNENAAKSVAILLQQNEIKEAMAVFPKASAALAEAETRYLTFLTSLETVWQAAHTAAEPFKADAPLYKKTFARIAGPTEGSAFLFQKLSAPEKTFRALVAQAKPNTLCALLKLNNIEFPSNA